MSENGEIKGVVSINADPAVQGFQKVEDAGKKAAQSLEKSAQNAAKGVAGIGDGASDAAKKIESETGRMAAAIQRSTIALQSGGRATADFYEANARLKGLNVDTLKPFIDNLRAVEAQQRQATNAVLAGNAALGNMGISAKQTAAALRQVPAQFTDIVVSLQGGQAPLTVLLQQGGQLKDVFGGAGNAARALGGYILGLVNPFTVAAAAGAGFLFAFEKGAAEQREFQKTLILTGNAAGVTAGQLADISARIDQFSGATQGKAAEALNIFANAGIKGADSLQRFTATAIEFERAGGDAVETVAKNFANLAKDPLKASLALNESTNFLTRSLYEQIKALEDQGKATEAAKLAQEAYNAALSDRTPQLLQNLGLIERGWIAIKDATRGAVDAALSIGRGETLQQQADSLRAQIEQRQGRNASVGIRDGRATEELKQQLYAINERIKLEGKSALLESERSAALKVGVQADELRSKYLGDQLAKTKELAAVQESFKKGGISASERDDISAAINKKYEPKTPKGASSVAGDSELTNLKARVQQEQIYLEQLKARGLAADKLNEGEKAAIRISEELKGSLSGRARSIKEAALEQAKLLGQTISQADAEKDFLRRQEEAAKASSKAYDDLVASISKSTDSTNSQIEKENAAAAAIGKTKDQIAELEAAKLDDLAASKDRLAVLAQDIDFSGELSAKYAAEAAALRDLAEAKKNRAGAEVANAQLVDQAKAAQKAVDDWKRASEQISSSLTDALLRGFESGKGFGDNLKDTFKNLSKTLILKPIIEMPVKQAVAALAPLQKKFTDFIAEQILGQKLLESSAVSGSATIVAAKQVEGQAAATAGVANQAGGDPYTAFFRIAAMAALMAGLGYAVKGGGGGSAPVTNQGTGTVFGDPTAKSASIENSIELLADTSKLGLRYSAQMANSLKNIEAAFAGVTNLVLRNGQIGKLEGSISTGNFDTGLSSLKGSLFSALLPGPLGSALGSLATKLFGKKVSIVGSGITGPAQSFGDIQDVGFQGNYYADIQTKRKFLGITTSTSNSTQLSALDAELANQFTQIFTGIGDSVTAAANALGIRTQTVQDALSSYIVDIGKIDLKGLTGDEIQEKLAAVFGAEADKIAAAVIPGFEQIQQVGEGYFETLVRAATQLESVNTVFGLLGGSLSVVSKNTDIFLQKLNGGFGTSQGVDNAIVADQLVQQFGGLEQFNEATGAFYESFYSQGERTRATLGLLTTSLDGLGLSLPTNAAAFRELTTSLDITTEAGREAFEALVTLGPTFAELQNQLLDAAGISGSAIADVLRDGMLGRITQAEIGQQLSSIIVDGIYNSLANGFAEQISNTFTNQIIAPLLQSVATGGVLSASISQASIDAVVASATNAANQLAAILGDQGFQAAIAGVQAAISGIAGAFPGKAADVAAQSYSNLGSSVNAASDAATKGADAWKAVGDSLTDEINRIRGLLTGGDKDTALAKFATLTAQARAGDVEAAKLLPSASQAYLQAVEESATSLLDIKRAQGFAFSSLTETKSIIGTSGPQIQPQQQQVFVDRQQPGSSFGSLITEVKLLREDVASLMEPMRATEANTKSTASALEDANSGRRPLITEAA